MKKFLINPKNKDADEVVNSRSDEEKNEVKRPRVGKSKVWTFFTRSIDGKTAKCNSCEKIYKTSGNTSNLYDHLKRVHPTLKVNDLPVSSGNIDSYISASYDSSSKRKKELDIALIKYIASDMRPFSVVEDTGFRYLLNLLDPRYKLPSRGTLRNVLMTNLVESKKAKLQEILNNVEHCAITTDLWTSEANETFLTVTCTFVSKDFDLRTAVLSTNKLLIETNHSAQNIADSLRAVFLNWKIFTKIIAIVTDNASSMIKACELLQIRHLPCFAHTINLVVQDCLKLDCMAVLLAKCKGIVTYFKSSTIAYKKFKDFQKTERKYSLKQEVPTRWNSAYHMIDRILQTHEAIGKVLLNTSKAPQPFSADEINLLKDFSKLLSPFDNATTQVSSNTLVTISLIIPVTCGLLHNLENLKPDLQTNDGLQACTFLMDNIIKRLSKYEERSVPRIGTLIDPRFKKKGFRSPSNIRHAEKLLENEITFLKSPPEESILFSSEPPAPIVKPIPSRQTLFQFVKENIEELPKTKRADAIVELRRYFSMKLSSEDIDPLKYWQFQHNEASIKDVAKKFLCIPATSTESERMFSKTGLIISNRRASLKAKHVDMLLFLQKNSWISD